MAGLLRLIPMAKSASTSTRKSFFDSSFWATIRKMRQNHLLLLIIVLAAVFRLWSLDTIPPGLYPDEAMNGNDALVTLRDADWKVFYPANNGREGLFINVQALFLQGFLSGGAAPAAWMLRLPSALIGIFTVLAIYWTTKEIFRNDTQSATKNLESRIKKGSGILDAESKILNSETLALLASFFTAISFWHVNFSRIGFRAIAIPLITTLFVLALLKAWSRRSVAWSGFAGFLLGLGFYTYISFRVVPVLAGVFFVRDAAETIKKSRAQFAAWIPFLKRWTAFALVLALTLIPIGGYFLEHPGDFFGRAGDVAVWKSGNPAGALGESLLKTIGMFNVAGDCNWRHNLACSPQLFWPLGIFFLIGVAYSVRKTLLAVHAKSAPARERFPFVLLVTWLFIGALPGILSIESVPHALRTIGAIPPAMMLAALGALLVLDRATRYVARVTKNSHTAHYARLAFLLFFSMLTLAEFYRYFSLWTVSPHVRGAFRDDLAQTARFLQSVPSWKRYVIVNEDGVMVDLAPYLGLRTPHEIPMSAETIIFLTQQDPTIVYLTKDQLEKIEANTDEPVIIVPLQFDDKALESSLKAAFPALQRREMNQIRFWEI